MSCYRFSFVFDRGWSRGLHVGCGRLEIRLGLWVENSAKEPLVVWTARDRGFRYHWIAQLRLDVFALAVCLQPSQLGGAFRP